eukprot:1723770-Prymnesium_polylepis.1
MAKPERLRVVAVARRHIPTPRVGPEVPRVVRCATLLQAHRLLRERGRCVAEANRKRRAAGTPTPPTRWGRPPWCRDSPMTPLPLRAWRCATRPGPYIEYGV